MSLFPLAAHLYTDFIKSFCPSLTEENGNGISIMSLTPLERKSFSAFAKGRHLEMSPSVIIER